MATTPTPGTRVAWRGASGDFAPCYGAVDNVNPDGSADVAFGPDGSHGTVLGIPAHELTPADD